jgi:hypothetical protein
VGTIPRQVTHMHWPHVGIDCSERCIHAALIIDCVECIVAESQYLSVIGGRECHFCLKMLFALYRDL